MTKPRTGRPRRADARRSRVTFEPTKDEAAILDKQMEETGVRRNIVAHGFMSRGMKKERAE